MASAHVIVLNHNGEEILPKTLPSVLEASRNSRHDCRVSVIDNESTDGSLAVLRESFRSMKIVPHENRVLASYNDVCASLKEDVVVLLNNDVKVSPDFLDPLIDPFEQNADLFMTSPKCMDFEGSRVMGSFCRAVFSGGLLRVTDEPAGEADGKSRETLAAGPAAAYDRRKFVDLGGFDDLYLPGTLEDVDLGFRAWRRGWRALYEPKSVVYHEGQHSFRRKFGARGIARINARNNFLFVWKNIENPGLRIRHALWTPVRLAYHALRGQGYWLPAYFEAKKRFASRPMPDGARPAWRRTDLEVIERFADGGSAGARFAVWRRLLKNWPTRVLERFGLVNGRVRYDLRNGLSLVMRGGRHSDALILWDVYVNEPYTRPFGPIEPDACVVDVGGHVGLFTTWAASQARRGRVISFEAHPVNYGLLAENVSRNGLKNVSAYHGAVSGKRGTAKLYVHEEGFGGNSLYREHVKQAGEKFIEVPAVTLDDVVRENKLDRIDLLKLDCEGAEYDILYGASADTLKRVKRIGLEYHRVGDQSVERLREHLGRHGFKSRLADEGQILYAWRNGS